MNADELLENYAAHLGIPVHDPAYADYPMWDGAALKRPDGTEDWAHEIAHWLLATPERRGLVNYGWGSDFQFLIDVEALGRLDEFAYLNPLPWPAADVMPGEHEEILACLLGFAILVRVGAHPPYNDYGFYELNNDNVWVVTDNVYAERRAVQPWVDGFKTWLAARFAEADR